MASCADMCGPREGPVIFGSPLFAGDMNSVHTDFEVNPSAFLPARFLAKDALTITIKSHSFDPFMVSTYRGN